MALAFRCSTAGPGDWNGEALAVGQFSGEAGDSSRHALTERFGAAVAERLEQRRFKAKPGECLSIDLLGQSSNSLREYLPELFSAHSLIACSLVSSLRFLSSGGSPPVMTSPKVTSKLWLQRS